MNRQNIEQIIRDLFKDNFRAYPDNYSDDNSKEHAAEVALSHWETRNDEELTRDKQAGVTKEDYIKWCLSELAEQKKVVN